MDINGGTLSFPNTIIYLPAPCNWYSKPLLFIATGIIIYLLLFIVTDIIIYPQLLAPSIIYLLQLI